MFKFFRSSLRHDASSPLIVAAASISLPFLFSSLLRLSLCPLLSLSFYLKLSGRKCLLFPVLSGYSDRRSFLPGNDTADKSTKHGALLPLSAMPCSIFSRIHSCRGVPSHLNSLIHRSPWFPLWNLCIPVTLDVPSLIFAATDTAFC